MSDAARLAKVSFSVKPSGVAAHNFRPTDAQVAAVDSEINSAALDAAFSAMVSYSEALSGIQACSISWSIVKLYYTCFYCLKFLLIIRRVVPFSCNGEFVLDLAEGRFYKGGNSSHQWNWSSLAKISRLRGEWFLSQDSQDAYTSIKRFRDNVNYTHSLTDPEIHQCLRSSEQDLHKRFQVYRDDSNFTYTYLADHLAIAFPTKLLTQVESDIKHNNLIFPKERVSHMKKMWKFKDKCLLT